ncbi:MAG: DUF3293 domain-containing protein [Gemmataceae bacterium]
MKQADDWLDAAYRKTSYWVVEGLVESNAPMVLRVDQPCPQGFGNLVGASPWAVLTACNPGSRPLDSLANANLFQGLRQKLDQMTLQHLAVAGLDPESGWVEPMVLVWPMKLDRAIEFAQELGQRALLAAKPEDSDCLEGVAGLFYTGL